MGGFGENERGGISVGVDFLCHFDLCVFDSREIGDGNYWIRRAVLRTGNIVCSGELVWTEGEVVCR